MTRSRSNSSKRTWSEHGEISAATASASWPSAYDGGGGALFNMTALALRKSGA